MKEAKIIAVILAGGKGTRLKPFSLSFPKALMPVGDCPILELLIRQLKKSGIKNIIIAVGYLESLIRAYFGDGSKFGVEITYSNEDFPLGTAGPLNLLKSKLTDTFLLLNGDILADISFSSLRDYHINSHSLATVAISKRNVEIDFGVVRVNSEFKFESWEEKPTLEYYVSTGIYVFEPETLRYLPNGFSNVPDLIVSLYNSQKNISVYHHPGFWLDIGRPEDYQKACLAVDNGDIRLE
ncbi:sugar phosphate nucleotidyltransferase [Acidobacteriota bacterium]